MNSLSQLNTASDVTLSFTDLRATIIEFDRATPIAPSTTFTAGGPSPAGVGINITSIINPGVVNAYYEIDVSLITGATVSWSTLPSGYSVTTPATGIYRVTGIQSAADWEVIKNATINSPSGRITDFTYTSKIVFTGTYGTVTSPKTWTTTVKYTQKAALAATVTQTVNGGILIAIIGNASIPATFSLTSIIGKKWYGASAVSASVNLTATNSRIRYNSSSMSTSASLTSIATKLKRVASALTSSASLTATGQKFISNITNRTYQTNTSNLIFSTSTPQLADATAGSSTYTITLTSPFGKFGTSTTQSSTYSYSGTQTQVNSQFANIYFWPDKSYSSNTTYTLTIQKDSVEVFSNTKNMTYSSSAALSALYTFTSSGTWTPTAIEKYYGSIDYLVVGGGGAGGASTVIDQVNGSGGGAAGDVLYVTSQSITQSSYSVTVGTGGVWASQDLINASGMGFNSPGPTAGAFKGPSGNSSSFNSTTATGGAGGQGSWLGKYNEPYGPYNAGPQPSGGSNINYSGGTGIKPGFNILLDSAPYNNYYWPAGAGGAGAGGNGNSATFITYTSHTGTPEQNTSNMWTAWGSGGAGVSNNISGANITYGQGGDGTNPGDYYDGYPRVWQAAVISKGTAGSGGYGSLVRAGTGNGILNPQSGYNGTVIIKVHL